MTELILASNSPRRRQLLGLTQWGFTVSVANIDESVQANESPADYVLRLAESKARAITGNAHQIILAADTTVVDGNDILGKPADNDEAFAMLTQLRGRTHQVYTGLALLRLSDGLLLKRLNVTPVPMRTYTDEEIRTYIATGDPLDKAGAYAIQHAEFHPVEHLSGCRASVMGLPLCHLTHMLQQMGVSPQTDVPIACQAHLQYDCPVFESVLRGEM